MKKLTYPMQTAVAARIAVSFIVIFCGFLYSRPVIVEGVGYTRDGAIKSALRSAVEQTVGVRISSQTMVSSFSLVKDKILSRAEGFVSSYTVISEGTEFGLIKVRVNADVALGQLEDSLCAQKLLYEIVNKPRIMVMLDERIEGKPAFEKTGTHILERALLERGYIVIESGQLDMLQKSRSEELADNGFKNGADFVIRGEVSVAGPTPKTVYGAQFYTVPVQINATVIRADNAQILASRTHSIKKNSREVASAGRFGLEIGGRELADRLIADLNAFWHSEAFNENRVELSVVGATSADMAKLDSLLLRLPFVRSVNLRYIERSTALYDLELRGTLQELRAALAQRPEAGFSIETMSAGRMTIRKGEAPVEEPPTPVEITAFSVNNIFPSLVRHYETHPPARIVLKSGTSAVHDLKVSVEIPDFMSMPAERKFHELTKGASTGLELPLVFDIARMLQTVETRSVYAQATISFQDKGKYVLRKLTAPVTVYEKNAMDWQNADGIASFVTYRDPAVDALARAAMRIIPQKDEMNRDLMIGLALFDAMRALGIRYMKDPASSPGAMTLDRVQYPAETLDKLGGDCDDLSVLYAALLSAAGIPAAIISYRDHVLVMFNTGIYEKNRLSISCDSIRTIAHNGNLWIPVETTRLSGDFLGAWTGAAAEFHSALTEKTPLAIIELERAWKKYPAAPVTIKTKNPVPDGLEKTVIAGLSSMKKAISSEQADEIAKLSAALSKTPV